MTSLALPTLRPASHPLARLCRRLLLVSLTFLLAPALCAEELGRITAIADDGQTIHIDYRALAARPGLLSAAGRPTRGESDNDAALAVGDYVIFKSRNGRLVTLQRVSADEIDVPGGAPLPATAAPQEG